jgi:CRP-like cAMP-binding protein
MPLRTLAIAPTPRLNNDSVVAHFRDGLLMHFKKGDVIIQGYEEPKGVHLIKSGFVKASSIMHDKHRNLLVIHKTSELIPLPWALDGEHPTGLYYEAMTDVEVLRAGKGKLLSAMDKNARLSREVLFQTVNVLSIYTRRIQILEYRTARERIISELIYFARRFGERRGKEILINAPITHQDIADSVNMSRETASRALGLLFKEGLMGQSNHLFIVRNVRKLQTAHDQLLTRLPSV